MEKQKNKKENHKHSNNIREEIIYGKGEWMLKKYFVKQGIKEAEIEEYIRTAFPLGDYSRTELQRTPLGIKVVIYTNKPGRIIGKGGKNINDITEGIKKRFDLENPQVDVKMVENPNLDARIIAKQITSALPPAQGYWVGRSGAYRAERDR